MLHQVSVPTLLSYGGNPTPDFPEPFFYVPGQLEAHATRSLIVDVQLIPVVGASQHPELYQTEHNTTQLLIDTSTKTLLI